MPDERLGLMFACAHPAIEAGIRAPLILQTILGFDAATIASAFLVSPADDGPAAGARQDQDPRRPAFRSAFPSAPSCGERLDAVLEAIYAAFAEGWSDPAGTETRRRNLADGGHLARPAGCRRCCRTSRRRSGLLALMLLCRSAPRRRGATARGRLRAARPSRTPALVGRSADRRGRGAAAARQPQRAASAATSSRRRCSRPMSPGALTGRADWAAIERLYDALSRSPARRWWRSTAPSPSRKTEGRRAGLAALDELADDPRLADYQPYWAARAGLLARLGDAKRPTRPICGRSAWSPTPPCAASWKPAALISRFSPAPRTAPSTDSARRRRG